MTDNITTNTEEMIDDRPEATVEVLESLEMDTIDQAERPPFRIKDDRCADWAVRKIAEEKAEYDRLVDLAAEQIEAINQKLEAAKRRYENGTNFLTSCLAEYFHTVPHKKTATTEKYRLLSGTLTMKKGGIKTETNDEVLVPWLRENGYGEYVKVTETAKWGELKKQLDFLGGSAIIKGTGEMVEGVTVGQAPDSFKVEV